MFNGLSQDHLHQFIASRPSSNNNNNNNINSLPFHSSNFMISSNSSFDSYPHLIFPLQHHQQLQQQQEQHDDHQIFLHHHNPILHHNKTLIATHDDDQAKDIIASCDVSRREREEEEEGEDRRHRHRQAVLTVGNLEIDRDRQRSASINMAHTDYDHPNAAVGGGGDHPWTTDEILALLRIRSTTENWFPDFTWEHVSRKLAELGFKMRSGEKCKERFEEESRYLNNINSSHGNDICTNKANAVFMPFLSDLDEELYSHNNTSIIEPQKPPNPGCELLLDKRVLVEHNNNNNSNSDTHIVTDEVFGATKEKVAVEQVERQETNLITDNNNKRKRKRSCFLSNSNDDTDNNNNKTKFEMFKGFCEEIVNKMMSHQEEMHNKLLEDMVKRDQEKLRKEEAWKKSEVDRMNKELDFMARQQAIAGDRQATIIEFLRKFTSTSATDDNNINNKNTNANIYNSISTSTNLDDDTGHDQKAKSTRSVTPSSSSTSLLPKSPNYDHASPSHVTNQNPRSELGKRWPRDEVLALINLRSSLYNNNNNGGSSGSPSSEGSNSHRAVPLWERISRGMGEKGFKRSAKRCKEKWENINKYFRKTKDTNKKRSVDSRTCPYFHQLSSLYGTSTLGDHHQHHHYRDQDRSSDQGDHRDLDDSSDSRHLHNAVVAPQGEKSETTVIATSNVVPVPPAFDFEF